MEFADGYEGVTHAGLLVVARDSGRMLLAQRAFDADDAPEVQESWEMPGGSLDDGEDAQAGAFREFSEEIGDPLEGAEVVHGWRSAGGDHYQGFVVAVDGEDGVDLAAFDPDEVKAVGWFSPDEARNLNLRPEFAANDLDALVAHAVSGNEDEMTDEIPETEVLDEPEFDSLDFTVEPIPIHGVLAPEEVPTGDQRGFNAGSITRRPLRLPFSWQKSAIGGHDGSVVTGSMDRLMRKDGKVHFQGLLMPSADTDELVDDFSEEPAGECGVRAT